jgi:hypothetical protein
LSYVAASLLKDQFFLLTDDYRQRILQADSNMANLQTLTAPWFSSPLAIAYDFREQRMYWSDYDEGVVMSANIDGSGTAVFLYSPGGVA